MMFDCKNCQHKVDGDCPCTSPGKCDFTEKKAVAEVDDQHGEWDDLTKEEMWNTIQEIRTFVGSDGTKSIISDIESYAESCHAKQCAECKYEYSLSKKCTRLDNGNDCHARNGDVCMNMFQCPEVPKCK